MNLNRFKTDYPAALAQAMSAKPDDYTPGLTADIVAERMIKAIETKGIGAVNIQSASFKTLAKQYGIKNTYKEWVPFLAA